MKTLKNTLLTPLVFCLMLAALAAHGQADAIYAWTNFVGWPGGAGSVDGTGCAARFRQPTGVAADSVGNVFVADQYNHTVRRVRSTGEVTTLAGLAEASGTNDGVASAARFNTPSGVAVDTAGNVFVADTLNHTIRKVTPAGEVTTFAGLAGISGSANGPGSAARFNAPGGIAVDTVGNVYVADTSNHTIRKVTPGGVVTTLAGLAGVSGTNNGTGGAARFKDPSCVTVTSAGTLFVADQGNHTIRKVTSTGGVTTLAGSPGAYGFADGTGSAARFLQPTGVAVDSAGNVFVADRVNHIIREVTAAGVVTTFAGKPQWYGRVDGWGSAARFYAPQGVAVDGAGTVFVADTYNHLIRQVSAAGEVTTLAGPWDTPGSVDGTGTQARFNCPGGVAVDSAGDLFVADGGNHTIRKVTPAGEVTTLAGLSVDTDGDGLPNGGYADGTGSAAQFYLPYGVAADRSRNVLYVADRGNHTIRKVTSAGEVTTLAGLAGVSGYADGTRSAAHFNQPTGVAVDSAGNVFVADYNNSTIRKVTAGGVVTTFAGSPGNSGTNNGTGSAAQFSSPWGVAVDSAGNVFVADSGNHAIRKITPASVVTTFVGTAGVSGTNDGTGSAARFSSPDSVVVDSSGSLFVADGSRIRKVTPAGMVTTVGGLAGAAGAADGFGNAARFSGLLGVVLDSAGALYVGDYFNSRISKGTPFYPWLTLACDGTQAHLSWSSTCLGWQLQAQTNSPGVGLGTNWFPVPGSTTTTNLALPLATGQGSVFYRLRSP